MHDELAHLDATAQARLVERREITPLELVDAAIARIERFDPRINAVVSRQFEQARERARGALPEGPFRGVPFLLKDLSSGAERGAPLTYACRLGADNLADHDTELVRRYKAAGLVIVGRSNTPEFGITPTTEPALFGPCRNPWSLDHSSGGSSGGAAAAVAARLVPLAHATDIGGSIRIPASACGVFGLKPSRGRNPSGPKVGEGTGGLPGEHCCSISVRDSAALLDATSAPDFGAPYVAPFKSRPYLDELDAQHSRLRIGVMRAPFGGQPVHADCLAAVESAAVLCRELGHEVRDIAPRVSDMPAVAEAFFRLFVVSAALHLKSLEGMVGRPAGEGDIEPLTRAVVSLAGQVSGTDFVLAQRTLQRMSREIAALHDDHDLLLSPTMAQPPMAIGEIAYQAGEPLEDYFARSGPYAAFTAVFNATGQPAMNVPLHWNATGLPIGVQFAARLGDEASLFRLAAELERARPWASRLPPLIL
ncbi:amidase [Zestomonas carbonaria]|uniref:6-aminohexanoate-cyclic-dimer hydrolase n=1 Tax=Zestomonas carbonaria TaxID=2762745 RepID=A0A7U7ENV8_9GAMM|nr:amidase [Pseudomonas carbonaria]CAD5108437.1 6-aminohexanoate-cyclic-dimer hydrolase [Pseudomonas carbonaria]